MYAAHSIPMSSTLQNSVPAPFFDNTSPPGLNGEGSPGQQSTNPHLNQPAGEVRSGSGSGINNIGAPGIPPNAPPGFGAFDGTGYGTGYGQRGWF